MCLVLLHIINSGISVYKKSNEKLQLVEIWLYYQKIVNSIIISWWSSAWSFLVKSELFIVGLFRWLDFIAIICLIFLISSLFGFYVSPLDLFAFLFIYYGQLLPLLTPWRIIMTEVVYFYLFIHLFLIGHNLQPGLAGINLGKFLIKRVVTQVKREMPHISVSILSITMWRFMEFVNAQHLINIILS